MTTNLYAPPRAAVRDIADPVAKTVLADRGTRLGANILDGLILAATLVVPFGVFGMIGAAARTPTNEANAGGMLALGAVLTLIGLGVWCWLTIRYIRQNGQSIAKKMVGIKVVRTDGSPASFGRIFFLRNAVNALLGIIPFYGVLDSLFIFGESRQCLHDKIADTIVVIA